MTIIPYRTLDNVIDGVVLTFVDITERRHLRRLATVLADANDAVTVYRLDGRITAWNRKACEIYGYTEEEALKMPITTIVPEEARQETKELLDALKTGKVLKPMILKRLTKEGRCIDVSVASTALRSDSGEIIAIATTEQTIEGGS
jgi:two-component system CheB/CheR fusion protein